MGPLRITGSFRKGGVEPSHLPQKKNPGAV
jgi:hypothetical protein